MDMIEQFDEVFMRDFTMDMELESTSNDDVLLDQLREIVSQYVEECSMGDEGEASINAYKRDFAFIRQQISDRILREHLSFEFMMKIYAKDFE